MGLHQPWVAEFRKDLSQKVSAKILRFLLFALISHALQSGRAGTAAQGIQAVTCMLLWTAKAGVSCLQQRGREANSPHTRLFRESVRHEISLGILGQRQCQGFLGEFKDWGLPKWSVASRGLLVRPCHSQHLGQCSSLSGVKRWLLPYENFTNTNPCFDIWRYYISTFPWTLDDNQSLKPCKLRSS